VAGVECRGTTIASFSGSVVRKGNGKLAYVGMPEADREMPELISQAAAWIKSDGIVVDNPELVTTRKVAKSSSAKRPRSS